ncbi:MAG TPA: MarR family transcriptional regulator [Gaiellaceae bacterium]|nr:MarR family transcriptional regulator [Gaiellaceae bacterium]
MPTLDDYRAAAELREALRRFARESERISRSHGLTPQRYQLLLMIKAAGGTATVTSLIDSLQLGQSGVTQLVQRAEALGLIERRAVREDARSQWLTLTRKGDRILARVFTELGPERDRLVAALNPTS